MQRNIPRGNTQELVKISWNRLIKLQLYHPLNCWILF